MERFPKSVLIRKRQSQAITKCYFVLLWITTIKKTAEHNINWQRYVNLELLYVINRYIKMVYHVGNSVAVLHRVKQRYTIWSSNSISNNIKYAKMGSKNSNQFFVSIFIAELNTIMKNVCGETLHLTVND